MAPQAGAGGLSEQEQKYVKIVWLFPIPESRSHSLIGSQVQSGMESCLVKSIMAGGMGFALGGAFGLFMSSVRVKAEAMTRLRH